MEYKGLTSIQASDILKALSEKKATLTQTQPYDETKIQKAVMIIKSLLAEKGRQKAEVEVTKEKVPPNSVLVTFNVTEGPKIKIDKIDFEGNKVFSDGELKKAMKLVKEAGALTGFTGKDAYHEGKLAYDLNSVRTLYAEQGLCPSKHLGPRRRGKRSQRSTARCPSSSLRSPGECRFRSGPKKATRLHISMKIEENSQYHVGDVKVTGAKALPTGVLQSVLGS